MSCAKPSPPRLPQASDAQRRWNRARLACFRLGLLAAAFFCLHLTAARRELGKSSALDPQRCLILVKPYLPAAASIGPPEGDDRLSPVLDSTGEPVGWAAQTSPESKPVTGYSGASNMLVIFDASRNVIGTTLLDSDDTAGHVAKITDNPAFFAQWNGRSQASLSSPNNPIIVSGASLTSEAMARGLAARFGASGMDEWFPAEIDLKTITPWFPDATALSGNHVLSASSQKLGTLLRSSRMGVAVRGFQGAQDVLVALDPTETRILGVAMPSSRDNEPHTTDVRDGLRFDTPFTGLTVEQALATKTGSTLLVSGASYTAESVEDTVKEMLTRHFSPPPESKPVLDLREILALIWISAGVIIGFSHLRGNKRLRTAFALLTVIAGGLWLGLMTGQDQWIKSAMRGSITGTAIPLLALTAAAILIPAAFGKNIYCSQLCPHGAAQQLVGHLRKRRFALPAKLHRLFLGIPWLTLATLWLLAFLGIGFPFAHAEPFEIWSAGFIALLPVAIFFTGLVAAIFLPQAYCHYGCPTGAVLKFLASSPGRWSRRDTIATVITAGAWISYILT